MCVLRENLVNKEKEARQQTPNWAQLFRKVSLQSNSFIFNTLCDISMDIWCSVAKTVCLLRSNVLFCLNL